MWVVGGYEGDEGLERYLQNRRGGRLKAGECGGSMSAQKKKKRKR
jgi:hypothetical protein